MLGWSINSSACRSASNRFKTLCLSIPSFNNFNATCDARGFLLCFEHDSPAAFAKALNQTIGPILLPSSRSGEASASADSSRVKPAEMSLNSRVA